MKRHLTKREREFIDWVSSTLIPDYEKSSPPLAEDLKLLVATAYKLDTDSVSASDLYDVQKFLDYIGYTLIPDLKKSGATETAKDLKRLSRAISGFLPDYDE